MQRFFFWFIFVGFWHRSRRTTARLLAGKGCIMYNRAQLQCCIPSGSVHGFCKRTILFRLRVLLVHFRWVGCVPIVFEPLQIDHWVLILNGYRGYTQTKPRPSPSQCLSMAHSKKLKGLWIVETILLRSFLSRSIPLVRGKRSDYFEQR